MISFENNGKIILSDQIGRDAFAKIGVTGQETLSDISEGNKRYLDQHRNRFAS